MTKICSKCGEEKDIDLFVKASRYKDGHAYHCKACHKIMNSNWYKKNKDRALLYQNVYNSRDYVKQKSHERSVKYYAENKKLIYENLKLNRKKKRELYTPKQIKELGDQNVSRLEEKRIKEKEMYDKYLIEKAKHFVESKKQSLLRERISSRIRMAIKVGNGYKICKYEDLLGCSIPDLKVYLEDKFSKEMSWNDFMGGKIQIDHIIPCAAFDLTKEDEQRKCFYYKNLQPLWNIENIRKSDKLPDGTRASKRREK